MPDLLIVEDEEAFRQFMGLALQMEGYQVMPVSNGAEAIDLLQQALPDLVLMDLSMPTLSGWDVLAYIRQVPALSHIPVIVVTANADEETRRRCVREKVDAVLIKPVPLDDILGAIRRLLI